MTDRPVSSRGRTIRSLQERAKELNCLYRVDEILNSEEASVDETLAGVIAAIPEGLQFPAACQARITWDGRSFTSPRYAETEWRLRAPLRKNHLECGEIEISYAAEMPRAAR